jgi:hypothetical protein
MARTSEWMPALAGYEQGSAILAPSKLQSILLSIALDEGSFSDH